MTRIPLNKALKRLSISEPQVSEAEAERRMFERRWNASNRVRTMLACLASALLLTPLRRP
ncbi:anthrone oxygenase family protein [Pseudomarimonas salicorniae]|uniref:anthrone oxygenase family protein n=1 Tax=Pseudomarimonas salicorniae TaxID=2933270 RepID=UPI003CCDC393